MVHQARRAKRKGAVAPFQSLCDWRLFQRVPRLVVAVGGATFVAA